MHGRGNALRRRGIGGEVIRAEHCRKDFAEIDELSLEAFDLEAYGGAAGEGQRHSAGRRVALGELDREQIEHSVLVLRIDVSTLAGIDALEP